MSREVLVVTQPRIKINMPVGLLGTRRIANGRKLEGDR
jgi:hypothetical protein